MESSSLKSASNVFTGVVSKLLSILIAFAISMISIWLLRVDLLLVPLLLYIVNSAFPQQEVVAYYILYLLNSVVSYFVVYKITVSIANHTNYMSPVWMFCETMGLFQQVKYVLLVT